MIKIEGELLKRLQAIELEMLVEVDRICRKHDIRYSLDGGTLLGAVRHNGFIPWDDDADVVMLREEYNKFFDVCRRELDTDRFFLQEYRTDTEYRWGYSKLRRNGTVFLREGQENIKCNQGVFIDIFVYDNVPDSWLLRRLHLFACFCIRKGLYSKVGKFQTKNMLFKGLYTILERVPRDRWFAYIEKIATGANRKQSQLVRHMTYPYRWGQSRYGLPRRCFSEFMDKEFEGRQFRVFKEYDLYLSKLYGNYMELPPKEKRITHPVSKLQLVDL